MKCFGGGLSEQQKELNRIIRRPEMLEQAKELFLEIHSKVHLSDVSDTVENEVDLLLGDLERAEYAVMPTVKDETIAWVLWHLARIEDLTMNLLVARREPVFDRDWQERLHVPITDTGHALTDDEIMELSREMDIERLICYRNEVGKRTRDIVSHLSADDLVRKVIPADLEKILATGGVTEQEDSIWLLDYWGQKDAAGLLLMPPTRHAILHLNDCAKWKSCFRTKTKFYRS